MVSPFAAMMLDAVLRFPDDEVKVAEALSYEALSKACFGEAHGAPAPASSVFGARPASESAKEPMAKEDARVIPGPCCCNDEQRRGPDSPAKRFKRLSLSEQERTEIVSHSEQQARNHFVQEEGEGESFGEEENEEYYRRRRR